jgi:aminobenzoyl-glutamate utilization protein B
MPQARFCIPIFAALLLSVPALAARAQRPSVDQLREEARQEAASMAKLTQEIVDKIFSHSEPGFQEKWTAAYITNILRNEGFTIQMGVAGIPTAYIASWGSGDPVVGIMGDIDGVPETSQKPGVAYRDPLVPGAPGHGEGHNSAAAVDLTAAIAVKRVMERHGMSGTIKVIPGAAEELLASRTYMVNAGVFEDMDIMLTTHISRNLSTSYGITGSGLVSTTFTFHGRSAHGAGSPWAGRSALDAVELMNVGWNFRREHLRLQQRSHYMIANGGSQPNVVPSEAQVWYYFRELDYPHIKELHELGQTMAQGAAMMTGTTVEERIYGSAWPQTMSKPLAERMHENILRVGLPQWSQADVMLANAAQRMMGQEEVGLPAAVDPELRESSQGFGGPSNDLGDVTWNVPTVKLRYPGNIPGMTGHHWSSAIAMATPIAHKGASHGGRCRSGGRSLALFPGSFDQGFHLDIADS